MICIIGNGNAGFISSSIRKYIIYVCCVHVSIILYVYTNMGNYLVGLDTCCIAVPRV